MGVPAVAICEPGLGSKVVLDPQPPGRRGMNARFKPPPSGFCDSAPNRPAQSPSPPGHRTLPGVSYKPRKSHRFELLTAGVVECLLHAGHSSEAHLILMATARHGDFMPSPFRRWEAKARRGKRLAQDHSLGAGEARSQPAC